MGKTRPYLDELHCFLRAFEQLIDAGDLRAKVKALVPVLYQLRKIGKSPLPLDLRASARDRLLTYLRAYPRTVIDGRELEVVAGIPEWARRVRELRVQFGWPIASGLTAGEMDGEGELDPASFDGQAMGPRDYVLLKERQDKEAAYRWHLANEIRRSGGAVKTRILEYLRRNVGVEVTGEELRYVAGNSSEWARRVRELRTEEGWPLVTKMTGRPDLDVGEYVLEMDRQSPMPDRRIADSVRRHVLRRDDYRCRECGWSHSRWNISDPRLLEIHHSKPHVEGGESVPENLVTLCNVCHDTLHAVDN